MSSFVKRKLQIWITLGEGTFGAGLGNTTILDGLRMSCEIEKGGHPSKNKAKIRIYGMYERDMNTLNTVKFEKALSIKRNRIKVLAGDDGGTWHTAFQGEISAAYAIYKSPPNLDFQVEALEGFYPAVAPAAPKSFAGSVPVITLMANLATQMGYTFENNGVTPAIKINNPYLPGSAYQQAASLADAANLEFGIDDGKLFIAPRGAIRMGIAPLISAATGMKEYPVFDKKGISLECLYNPSVIIGCLITVKSQVANANRNWRVNMLKHHLECEHPGGKWETHIKASYLGS